EGRHQPRDGARRASSPAQGSAGRGAGAPAVGHQRRDRSPYERAQRRAAVERRGARSGGAAGAGERRACRERPGTPCGAGCVVHRAAPAPADAAGLREDLMSDDPEATQETFLSHLIELRTRLMRSIIAVVIVLLALFPFAKEIYSFLALPLLHVLPHGSTMIATDVTGTFLVPLKVTLMTAFMIALPYVLYQAWAFVAPGLYQHEKRLV